MRKVFLFATLVALGSCTTVDTGKEGVLVSWGGETNMNYTLKEGVDWGFHYLYDDVVEYDVREVRHPNATLSVFYTSQIPCFKVVKCYIAIYRNFLGRYKNRSI